MTKTEQVRLVGWRSKILQHASGENRTVSQTCRFFGISRKTYDKWANRWRTHGDAGLADRARVARRFPRATPATVVSKILYLRQHYHFGAGRIADYLRRFHAISVARSTVHRLLVKHGVGRLPVRSPAIVCRWM
jgi:transposase